MVPLLVISMRSPTITRPYVSKYWVPSFIRMVICLFVFSF